jgi:hypothetical protein
MITYSVVVARDYEVSFDELVLETYSNEKAAQEHEKFVEDNNCVIDDYEWDYVFIRETQVADVFEKE